jgi:SAM-dependent methyltransferase
MSQAGAASVAPGDVSEVKRTADGLPGQETGPGFDSRTPNAARIYDYLLGGKDHFAADRQAAARLLEVLPHSAQACQDNRAFLERAVRFLAGAGIRQFLDIGTGLPTAGAVHEVAQETASRCRVAYVDNDPVVLTHARALLATDPLVIVVDGDLTDPQAIVGCQAIRAHLDLTRPAAVLLVAVLHFVDDAHRPRKIIQTLADAVAPGSYLAVSHVTADHVSAQASAMAQEVYEDASAGVTPRTRAQVTRFFDGLELIEPGVVDIRSWHPEIPSSRAEGGQPPSPTYMYGGVARKPGRPRGRD